MNNNITLEYLDELDNGLIKNKDGKVISMPNLTYDKNFKVFFKSNEIMLKRFLKSVLHLDIDINDMKVTFLDKELLESKLDSKSNTLDYYININGSIDIDLEINRDTYENKKYQLFQYRSRMISNSLKAGEKYQDFKNREFIQLNLNAVDKSSIGEDIVCSYSLITKSIHIDNVITYLRYLDYYRKIYYNKFIDKEESDYWLALLTAKTFKEFYEIMKCFLNKDLVDSIMKDVIRLSMDSFFTEQELINLEKQYIMDRERNLTKKGIEQGIKKGIEQGIEQGQKSEKISIAKNLLKLNIDIENVSKATGLSIKELEELQ